MNMIQVSTVYLIFLHCIFNFLILVKLFPLKIFLTSNIIYAVTSSVKKCQHSIHVNVHVHVKGLHNITQAICDIIYQFPSFQIFMK